MGAGLSFSFVVCVGCSFSVQNIKSVVVAGAVCGFRVELFGVAFLSV